MKHKMEEEKKTILFLALLMVAGCIFTLCYLAVTGNTHQAYHDIALGNLTYFPTNKSSEKLLINLLAFGGVGACFVYCLLTQRGSQPGQIVPPILDYQGKGFVCALFVVEITYYVVYQNINQLLLIPTILLAAILLVDKSSLLHGLSFYYLSVYALCGIYRIYLAVHGTFSLNITLIALAALVFSVAILFSGNRMQYFMRGCLVSQLFIPGLLLIYLLSSYKQDGTVYRLPIPINVYLLIFGLIVLFTFEVSYVMLKNWSKRAPLQRCISFGSCVCIWAFNSFYGTGAVFSMDMHHPFEDVISFSQVFELGRGLFSDYIPPSGLFPIVEGMFFRFFGQDMMANYTLSHNIYILFFILINVAVLRPLLSAEYILLVSLFFPVLSYSRPVFILPIMLLLSAPKLIENKNLWLKLWLLTSLFHGLFYPLLGTAVCVAYLPLGIWQILTFVRMPEFKREIRKVSFWAPWVGCFLLVAASVPLLLGTLRHMLAMAGQSVTAEGITRFAQVIPNNFLPYLGDHELKRVAVYDLLSFMVPAVFVWVAFVLALKAAAIQRGKKGLSVRNIQGGCVAVAVAIMPLIAYTFTTTRLDVRILYARSAGPLYAGAVMLIVLAARYLSAGRLRLLIVCFAFFIPALNAELDYIADLGFFKIDSKLSAYYTVPSDYVYASDHNIERMGITFLPPSTYNSIKSCYEVSQKLSNDASYMGIYPLFGYYFLFGTKGDATIETGTVRGYSAAKETIDILRKNCTIVGRNITPHTNYYLYHWLVTSGEYVWAEESQMFFPSEDGMSMEQIQEQNKNVVFVGQDFALGGIPGSLGLSMDSLKGIFTSPETDFTLVTEGQDARVRFSAPVDGDQADYIYIEFANMDSDYRYVMNDNTRMYEKETGRFLRYLLRKDYNPGSYVRVSWQSDEGDTCSINCNMSEGKLLIPLGAGQKWLMHEHDGITISAVKDDNTKTTLPEIADIQFLKLREIE